MELLNGRVRIEEIKPVNDSQGRTYECFKNEIGSQVTLYERTVGYSSNHYHLGEDSSKDPEKFLLIKGSIKIEFYDMCLRKSLEEGINTSINGKTEIRVFPMTLDKVLEIVINTATDGKTEIRISPMIRHKVTALTNITFLEYRTTPFDKEKPDTYTVEALVEE